MTTKMRQFYCMRPMEMDDIDVVSLWFEHIADLSIFDRSAPIPCNKSVLMEDWKDVLSPGNSRRGYWFGIEDTVGKLVGICGLEQIDYVNGDGILAMYLNEEARKKGIARLASGVIVDLAFNQLRLNRITSYYREDNVATEKLTRAFGFSREGIRRKGWFASGRYFDIVSVGLLASEWPNARDALLKNLGEIKKIEFGRPPWEARKWPDKLT